MPREERVNMPVIVRVILNGDSVHGATDQLAMRALLGQQYIKCLGPGISFCEQRQCATTFVARTRLHCRSMSDEGSAARKAVESGYDPRIPTLAASFAQTYFSRRGLRESLIDANDVDGQSYRQLTCMHN